MKTKLAIVICAMLIALTGCFNQADNKTIYDMMVPIIWQNGNALVFYWNHTEMGKKTAFEDDIRKALIVWKEMNESANLR